MGILNLNTPGTAQSYGMESFNQKGQKLTVEVKPTLKNWLIGLGFFGSAILAALTIGVFTVIVKEICYFLTTVFLFQKFSWYFSFYLACVLYLVKDLIYFLVKPNAK